ncbi:MAG: hypothetical protein ACXW0T_08870, partial [Methylobacter sp.]
MSIVRAERKDTFTIINNKIMNDSALDWKDLGLLVYLLSKPDNWATNAEHLALQRNLGIKGVYTGLKAIVDAGYATKKPNPKGGWDWLIFDEPQSHRKTANDENRNSYNRTSENRTSEKRRLVNTETTVNTEKEHVQKTHRPAPNETK